MGFAMRCWSLQEAHRLSSGSRTLLHRLHKPAARRSAAKRRSMALRFSGLAYGIAVYDPFHADPTQLSRWNTIFVVWPPTRFEG